MAAFAVVVGLDVLEDIGLGCLPSRVADRVYVLDPGLSPARQPRVLRSAGQLRIPNRRETARVMVACLAKTAMAIVSLISSRNHARSVQSIMFLRDGFWPGPLFSSGVTGC